jgi:hypothetical protein
MATNNDYIAAKLVEKDFWNNLSYCKNLIQGFISSEILKPDFLTYLAVSNTNIQSCEALCMLCDAMPNNLITANTNIESENIGITLSNVAHLTNNSPINQIFMNRELEIAVKGLNTCYTLLDGLTDDKLLALDAVARESATVKIKRYKEDVIKYKQEITDLLKSQTVIWQEQKTVISQEIIVLSKELQKEKEKANPSTLKIWKDKAADFVRKYKFQFLFLGLNHGDDIAKAVNIDIPEVKMDIFKEILGEVKDMFF